jgi:hypothetical protein
MRILKSFLFLFLNSLFVHAQEMDPGNQKIVSDFINCIKNQNKEKLASSTYFPLERMYPIPDIKNKQELIKRYAEIFDDSLSKLIANSKPLKDWSTVGWRGIMFQNGLVWLDYDGSLIGVNYQSNMERQKWEELVKKDKVNLYEPLRNFEQPQCIIKTSKYLIRIDDVGNGNYRYASWPLKSKMSDKPDMVIEKGEYIAEGSGGNGKYQFKSGEYIYDCEIIVIGEDNSPPAMLTIYKGEKEILSQRATIIR